MKNQTIKLIVHCIIWLNLAGCALTYNKMQSTCSGLGYDGASYRACMDNMLGGKPPTVSTEQLAEEERKERERVAVELAHQSRNQAEQEAQEVAYIAKLKANCIKLGYKASDPALKDCMLKMQIEAQRQEQEQQQQQQQQQQLQAQQQQLEEQQKQEVLSYLAEKMKTANENNMRTQQQYYESEIRRLEQAERDQKVLKVEICDPNTVGACR